MAMQTAGTDITQPSAKIAQKIGPSIKAINDFIVMVSKNGPTRI
jgi:hypothetical protein